MRVPNSYVPRSSERHDAWASWWVRCRSCFDYCVENGGPEAAAVSHRPAAKTAGDRGNLRHILQATTSGSPAGLAGKHAGHTVLLEPRKDPAVGSCHGGSTKVAWVVLDCKDLAVGDDDLKGTERCIRPIAMVTGMKCVLSERAALCVEVVFDGNLEWPVRC